METAGCTKPLNVDFTDLNLAGSWNFYFRIFNIEIELCDCFLCLPLSCDATVHS